MSTPLAKVTLPWGDYVEFDATAVSAVHIHPLDVGDWAATIVFRDGTSSVPFWVGEDHAACVEARDNMLTFLANPAWGMGRLTGEPRGWNALDMTEWPRTAEVAYRYRKAQTARAGAVSVDAGAPSSRRRRDDVVEDPTERWDKAIPHHPEAMALMRELAALDRKYGDRFGFKFGGDGDNGEEMCFLLSAVLEAREPVVHPDDSAQLITDTLIHSVMTAIPELSEWSRQKVSKAVAYSGRRAVADAYDAGRDFVERAGDFTHTEVAVLERVLLAYAEQVGEDTPGALLRAGDWRSGVDVMALAAKVDKRAGRG